MPGGLVYQNLPAFALQCPGIKLQFNLKLRGQRFIDQYQDSSGVHIGRQGIAHSQIPESLFAGTRLDLILIDLAFLQSRSKILIVKSLPFGFQQSPAALALRTPANGKGAIQRRWPAQMDRGLLVIDSSTHRPLPGFQFYLLEGKIEPLNLIQDAPDRLIPLGCVPNGKTCV